MSAAAAEGATPKKGKKKLLVFGLVGLLVLALAGGGAVLFLKQRAAQAATLADEDGGGDEDHAEAAEDSSHKTPPTFVALDPFTVNLADRDAERFAQIGITLELGNPKVADELKLYMPAVRDALLMVLAHKSSTELLERSGKEQLAEEVRRETARAMGYRVAAPKADADDEDEDDRPKKKRKAKVSGPIRHVLFSSFIIQ